jgi:drug/metabolite transporter (DMT)-like permease
MPTPIASPSSSAAAAEWPLHLLFPLLSSLLYVAAALSLKRATETRAGVWRTTFVMNVVAAICFAALLPLAPGPAGPRPPWQPLTLAALFVAGQALTMLALNRGDVSVATPVIGLKVVFVTFFVALVVGDRMLVDYWLSAGMSALGIALLNFGGGGGRARHHHVLLTALTSLAAAACYAMFDTLVRKWSPSWGVGRLLPSAMSMAAVLSLGLWPLFEGRLRDLPRASRGPVLSGSIFMGLQAVSLVATLGLYPDTTRINVVYNSRGLWSVLAVWLVGHWWDNTERHAGRAALLWRMAGAGLMLGAIVVAVIHPIEGMRPADSPQFRAVR